MPDFGTIVKRRKDVAVEQSQFESAGCAKLESVSCICLADSKLGFSEVGPGYVNGALPKYSKSICSMVWL